MTQRSRDSRRAAAQRRDRAAGRPGRLLPAAAALVVVLAAIGAIVLTQRPTDGGSSELPSDLPAASPSGSAAVPDPVVDGIPLAAFQDPAGDPAIGEPIPTVTGPTASITANGKAKVLLFLAHWCPHCQAEVPRVQEWIQAGGLPADVELIAVSTAIDPDRPNYPPEDWLTAEGWTPPVIQDPTGVVAQAYGLSAFPFWVFVGADGTVHGRTTGELQMDALDSIIAGIPR